MNHEPARRSVAVTVLLLAAAGVLWVAVVAALVMVVPGYERSFRNQGLRLAPFTEGVLAAGRWADAYWFVLPPFGLFVLPVVVLLSWLLRHRINGPWPGWLWFGALLGVPLVLQLAVWLALLLP